MRRRDPVRQQTRAIAQNVGAVAAGLRPAIPAPASPHGRPAVAMLMGLPGVGKSHAARLLAARLGAVHIASDRLRSLLFVAPTYTQHESETVFRVLDALVASLLGEGHRVVVDATYLLRAHRAGLETAARERGAPLAHVLVTADEALVRERLAARRAARAPGDHSDADERVYDAMRARGFEEPDGAYLTLRNSPAIGSEIERVARELEARWAPPGAAA